MRRLHERRGVGVVDFGDAPHFVVAHVGQHDRADGALAKLFLVEPGPVRVLEHDRQAGAARDELGRRPGRRIAHGPLVERIAERGSRSGDAKIEQPEVAVLRRAGEFVVPNGLGGLTIGQVAAGGGRLIGVGAHELLAHGLGDAKGGMTACGGPHSPTLLRTHWRDRNSPPLSVGHRLCQPFAVVHDSHLGQV